MSDSGRAKVFRLHHSPWDAGQLVLDQMPSPRISGRILELMGPASATAMQVCVDMQKLWPPEDGSWWMHRWDGPGGSQAALPDTINSISVPIAKCGKDVHQLVFGEGAAVHGLVAGTTGSGKSNMLQVIITNLALKYSPEELELYLVDFKEGVEFRVYADAKLPHARVVAIETEQEFGLSVLEALTAEHKRRSELFTSAANLADHRARTGERLPRILLIVDEFQGLFNPEGPLAEACKQHLTVLARQGRSSGIHVLLSTQTLAQSNLPSAAKSQFNIRIALKCTAADSQEILAEDNSEARLLRRQGEACFNAIGGLKEGNLNIQVAKWPGEEEVEKLLDRAREQADAAGWRAQPVVFRGSDMVPLQDCEEMAQAAGSAPDGPAGQRAGSWLGLPLALRPPLPVTFLRRAEHNLVVVTRDEPDAMSILAVMTLGLLARHRPDETVLHVVDFDSQETSWPEQLASLPHIIDHPLKLWQGGQVPALLDQLTEELDKRIAAEGGRPKSIFVFIQGLQRSRHLRPSDSFSMEVDDHKRFVRLLQEGPEQGIHTIVWADTWAALDRNLRGAGNFAFRVAGPMTTMESQNLIQHGAAGQIVKPHRLLYYDVEKPGRVTMFRPYTLPEPEWLEQFCNTLRSR